MATGNLVTGLFTDAVDAHRAVAALIDAGYPRSEMSVVASDSREAESFAIERRSRVGDGAAIGAGLGGAIGALLAGFSGLGAIVLGGTPLLVAGPIVAALAGAGAGAATGGVIGGLIGLGVPEDEVNFYQDSIGKGSVLLGVRCAATREPLARDILKQHNATRITAKSVAIDGADFKSEPSAIPGDRWATQSPLHRLFIDQLRDVYFAEHQLTKAMAKMETAAHSGELAGAIASHLDETRVHISRIESIFDTLGVSPEQKKCPAIQGIIAEATELMEIQGPGPLKDAAIICAAQKAEHYEIGTYGCLRTYAQTLGLHDVADTLDLTLSEEWAADRRMTTLATSGINTGAALAI